MLLTFYVLSAVILLSALMVITRRNTVAAAMFLAVSLIGVAALYVSVSAEFLFAVQVLVYTGGVMVLFLFVIMLVNLDDLEHVRGKIKRWWLPAGLVVVTVGIFALGVGGGGALPQGGGAEQALGSNTKAVALELFTGYILPFEIVSILLLVAMIGAILLAKKEIEMVPASHYVILSLALFAIGAVGVLTRRNAIIALMSLELMFNAANINLVVFSSQLQDLTGQVFGVFVIAIAAGEAAIGLAIVLALYRNKNSIFLDDYTLMKG